MVSSKIPWGEQTWGVAWLTQMELSRFEIHLYRERSGVVGKEGERMGDKKTKGKRNVWEITT